MSQTNIAPNYIMVNDVKINLSKDKQTEEMIICIIAYLLKIH